MTDLRITPEPSEEEVAAILAAVEITRPRVASSGPSDEPPRWRWSGRWWTKPIPQRRNRPY
jgi:hypothetical protein